MAQKNRANMLTDIVSNIYNNLINFITGQNAQDRFVNLLDSSPNILSDASQANGYVSTDANNEMFSNYYNENDSRANIITKQGLGELVGNKFYQINDAVGSTITLQVCAENAFILHDFAIDVQTGEIGTYDITTDVFTPIVVSGTPNIQQVLDEGNTSTTPLKIDDGAGNSFEIQADRIKIVNPLGGNGQITSSTLTSTTVFNLPNKAAGTQTFAMLSDIGAGSVPYTGATADVDLGIHSLTADTIGIGVAAGAEKLHIDGGATTTRVKIDADNGVSRILSFRTDDLQRWALRVDGIESGANSGGDFQLRRYNDAGAHIDNPIAINRANGNITTAQNINGATPTELGYLSGVTSAIQTQLNNKVTVFASAADGTASSGTTNTISISVLIPANTFALDDVIRINHRVRATGVLGIRETRIYANTTNAIAGAVLVSTASLTSTTLAANMQRFLAIKNASTNTEVVTATTNQLTDYASFTTAVSTLAINWTVDQYIIFAVNAINAADSIRATMYSIEKL
jgi:hypothetical protein